MQKFRFTAPSPAKPAKVAKTLDPQGVRPAKPLLKFAKIGTNGDGDTNGLANVSKLLASQKGTETGILAGLAALAAPKSVKPQFSQPNLTTISPEQRAEYSALWNRAWALADYVDGDTVPHADRLGKLPELDSMIQCMGEIEAESTKPTALENEWHPWKDLGRDKKPCTPDTCPGQCKNTGKCHGVAYFKQKPGKPVGCSGEQCPWLDQLKEMGMKP